MLGRMSWPGEVRSLEARAVLCLFFLSCTSAAPTCSLLTNLSFDGNDIEVADIEVAPHSGHAECCEACSTTPGCVAFTLYGGKCFLKGQVLIRSSCEADEQGRPCISGLLQRDAQLPRSMALQQAHLREQVVATGSHLRTHCQQQAQSACESRALTAYTPQSPADSFKLIVPGHGSANRTVTMLRSIELVRQSVPANMSFSCEIFVYSEIEIESDCAVTRRHGLWTDFMKAERSSSTWVAIMMDDVSPLNLHVGTFLNTMQRHGIHAMSPAILPKWHWELMNQRQHCLVRQVTHVDILFVVFTRAAYACWQKQIDVVRNHYGWGYDVAFSTVCNVSVGIADQHLALHTTSTSEPSGEIRKERLYSESRALEDMWSWLHASLNWTITSGEDGMQQLVRYNDRMSSANAAPCVPGPALYLYQHVPCVRSATKSKRQRRGWRAIMSRALQSEVVSVNQRGGQVMLIDCAESVFMCEARTVREDWVAIVHHQEPARRTAKGAAGSAALASLLHAPPFVQSLPWCKGLIVFSEDTAQLLRQLLPVPVRSVPSGPPGDHSDLVYALNRTAKNVKRESRQHAATVKTAQEQAFQAARRASQARTHAKEAVREAARLNREAEHASALRDLASRVPYEIWQPGFQLLDASYFENVEHRGGWRAIMRRAIDAGVVSTTTQLGKLLLLDCTEKTFVWPLLNGGGADALVQPWVGIVHYAPYLPATFPTLETLQGLLGAPAFAESLSWCRGLLVFSNHVAGFLRPRLSVPIRVLKHPLAFDENDRPPQFSMHAFVRNAADRKVIMLGQQYRRISTIHRLKVKYPKYWLPGQLKALSDEHIRKLLHRDPTWVPQTETVLDATVKYFASHAQYDEWVTQNVIVIDLWDASANNAVLEAIAMNNPIFVSRHPAVIEYLGRDYPMYFADISDVEAVINDDQLLVERMHAAHLYLTRMAKDDLTMSVFVQALNHSASSITAYA